MSFPQGRCAEAQEVGSSRRSHFPPQQAWREGLAWSSFMHRSQSASSGRTQLQGRRKSFMAARVWVCPTDGVLDARQRKQNPPLDYIDFPPYISAMILPILAFTILAILGLSCVIAPFLAPSDS